MRIHDVGAMLGCAILAGCATAGAGGSAAAGGAGTVAPAVAQAPVGNSNCTRVCDVEIENRSTQTLRVTYQPSGTAEPLKPLFFQLKQAETRVVRVDITTPQLREQLKVEPITTQLDGATANAGAGYMRCTWEMHVRTRPRLTCI